ncbi:MAG: ABC transporter ATP-binding protein [Candidatus Yonathbacteria bacterium]|nr:ABC transporter ATP-binding protein [Candidatus Yonathbacteria bacterium]
MISVSNLKKIFNNGDVTTEALRGIDLTINDGEYVIITGRSGAGKSTLMYQMGLLDEPSSGTIEIDGVCTQEMTESERTDLRLTRLGYVFQDYALLPELTALENVLVPLLMEGRPMEAARELARKGLKRVGLEDKLNNLPSQLSGGQQQRVSIARAIANEPSILFADEPTANLDSQTADTVMQAFREIHEAGQTIIMVTHELNRVPEADRVIVLSDGLIEKETKR